MQQKNLFIAQQKEAVMEKYSIQGRIFFGTLLIAVNTLTYAGQTGGFGCDRFNLCGASSTVKSTNTTNTQSVPNNINSPTNPTNSSGSNSTNVNSKNIGGISNNIQNTNNTK